MKRKKDWADMVVAGIIHDLTDRSGLADEWNGIDDDIQREIKVRWAEIVREFAEAKPTQS